MKNETWRPVVGYEGLYEISDLGRFKSLARNVTARGKPRRLREHIREGCLSGPGTQYLKVTVTDRAVNRKQVPLHRLVAEAFIGPRPFPGAHICHSDGNSSNNCLENLRYDTAQANRLDTLRRGDHRVNGRVSQQLAESWRNSPLTLRELALESGYHAITISRHRNGHVRPTR